MSQHALAVAEFGQRVRTLRKKRGFSQERFASACGVDRSYMGQIERGEKNVTLRTMIRLAVVLEVDVSELVQRLPIDVAASKEPR